MAMPCTPIGPESNDKVARPDGPRVGDRVGEDASHPGRGDEDAVPLAVLDDLGVAGDQLDSGLIGRPGHRRDDLLQIGQRKALLQDERRRHPAGQRPAGRQVVDRAVHGQRADVAAREERRTDDEAIGRERQLRLAQVQVRAVVVAGQLVTREMLVEDVPDQAARHPSAAAVREQDAGAGGGRNRTGEVQQRVVRV